MVCRGSDFICYDSKITHPEDLCLREILNSAAKRVNVTMPRSIHFFSMQYN